MVLNASSYEVSLNDYRSIMNLDDVTFTELQTASAEMFLPYVC